LNNVRIDKGKAGQVLFSWIIINRTAVFQKLILGLSIIVVTVQVYLYSK